MRRNTYVRPTRAIIHTEALEKNFRTLQRIIGPETGILAVVKANGYGHGSAAVARLFMKCGAVGVAVADVSEALILRKAGLKGQILCLGAIHEEALADVVRHDLTVTIHSADVLRRALKWSERTRKSVRIHVKVDTGMNRLGIRPKEWATAAAKLKAARYLKIEGIFSHFSESESEDSTFTELQLMRFQAAVRIFEETLGKKLIRHMANSGGALRHPMSRLDWVRPGIALYGYPPVKKFAPEFRPALTLKAPILQVFKIAEGDAVSYNRTFVAKKPTIVATVAAGYGDGYRRSYATVGVGCKEKRCPIVGTICMDLLMIDVTQVSGVKPGYEVYLMDTQGKRGPTANELARAADTIPYEVLTSIGPRVSRVYDAN